MEYEWINYSFKYFSKKYVYSVFKKKKNKYYKQYPDISFKPVVGDIFNIFFLLKVEMILCQFNAFLCQLVNFL